ncbi:unnamed protein product [Prunus armeniaca]
MATSHLKIDGILGLITIRLKDDNFLKWRYQLESVLDGYDLFGHFDGSNITPPKFAILDEEGVTSKLTAAYKDWLQVDKALLSLLIAMLSDDALKYVIGCKTAHDAWMNLTDRYATVSHARINHLKTELQTPQKGSDSIEKFLLRLKHIRDHLAIAGVLVFDNDMMIAALNGLPSEYDMIRTVLVASDTSLSFKNFRNQLLAAEQAAEARVLSSHAPMVGMLSHSSSSGSSHAFSGSGHGDGLLPTPPMPLTAYMSSQLFGRSFPHASGGRGKFSGSKPFGRGFQGRFQGPPKSGGGVVPECQICSKRGHTAVNCYFLNSTTAFLGSSSTIECQICGKKDHGALDCYHRSNYVYQGSPPPASITAMAAQTYFSPDAVWIADSGACHHTVPHMTTMDSASPCTFSDQVRVGNGEGLRIDHIGSAYIPTATSSLSLSSVFHVPQLTANLFYVYHLCRDNNCRMIFDQFGFSIQDKVTNRVLFHGKSDHGLYPIPCSVPVSTHVDNKQPKMAFVGQQIHSSLWHKRLGHPTNEVVQLMLKEA